jgi:hypothetical protein
MMLERMISGLIPRTMQIRLAVLLDFFKGESGGNVQVEAY